MRSLSGGLWQIWLKERLRSVLFLDLGSESVDSESVLGLFNLQWDAPHTRDNAHHDPLSQLAAGLPNLSLPPPLRPSGFVLPSQTNE